MIHFLSLFGIIFLALSQTKHFKTVFKKRLSDKQSLILKVAGWSCLIAPHFWLVHQPHIGVHYVTWFCWVSIWIMMSGVLLSSLAKR